MRRLLETRFVGASVAAAGKGSKKREIIDVDAEEEDLVPWIDLPPTRETLCVHKRKVEDVSKWLQEALYTPAAFRHRRVLVLSGPAGAGKTATVRVLADELGFDLLEYRSPDPGSVGLIGHFADFLSRAGAVAPLAFVDDNGEPPRASTSKQTLNSERSQVVLVEDLPNVFTSSETKDSFRAAIAAYAGAQRAASAGIPLVLVVSEAVARPGVENEFAALAEGSTWQDSVTARTLLNSSLFHSGRVTEIRFNPVAPTLLKKALQEKVKRSAEPAASRLDGAMLDAIVQSANGDLRSAFNTAQMVLRSGSSIPKTAKRARTKKARTASESAPPPVQLNAARESALLLFHAIGKVVYSKRWGEDAAEDKKDLDRLSMPGSLPKLPRHLARWERAASKVDLPALSSDLPVDADMFLSYLQQNYPAFLDHPDQADQAAEGFSDADILSSSMPTRHPLTQSYAFQVSTRDLMMSLPTPVPRRGQKLLKAVYWDSMRRVNENRDDMCMLQRSLSGDHASIHAAASWRVFATETLPFYGLAGATIRSTLSPAQSKLVSSLCRFETASGGATLAEHGEDGGEDRAARARMEDMAAAGAVASPAAQDDDLMEDAMDPILD